MELLRSTPTEWFPVDDASVAGSVRRAAVRLADRLGFTAERAAESGIVASELATNVVRHAHDGQLALQIVLADGIAGIEITSLDRGPGMDDLTRFSSDGHTTGGTLGVGLGAVTRLSSRIDVSSQPGVGTVLVADLWPTRTAAAVPVDVAGFTRSMTADDVCGDAVAGRRLDGINLFMVCDGLGHGPLAALPSAGAVETFHETTSIEPTAILAEIGARIDHTRGAAIAVIAVDTAFQRLDFAGIGNISVFVDRDERRQALPSHPGIVGHHHPRLRPLSTELDDESIVVMHSDGVREAWNLRDTPGLRRRSAAVIAATVLRDAANRPDDASIVALRHSK